MQRARKRLSWQMELPYMGDFPAGTYCCRNSIICASASDSLSVEAFTLSISPDFPWVLLFQASIPSNTASDWCTTSTGDSASVLRLASVITTANSRMTSDSGSSPLITKSIHIRLSLSCAIMNLVCSRCSKVRDFNLNFDYGYLFRSVHRPARLYPYHSTISGTQADYARHGAPRRGSDCLRP